MKKILGKLLNRIVIFGILLAVQLGWFLLTLQSWFIIPRACLWFSGS